MQDRVAIVGFGEAGRCFARHSDWARSAAAYDIKLDGGDRCAMAAAMRAADVVVAASLAELADARTILCLVTADQSLVAAEMMASHIGRGALYVDCNSVAPQTKRQSAAMIESAGARYVDAAIMAPVDPLALAVPVLVAGEAAADAEAVLTQLGFTNVRHAGHDVGRAATIKMLRSVIYKGMEALTAECVLACDRAGVLDEVLASLGSEWPALADYRLDRMMTHGTRRAAEMREAVATLEQLGIDPLMTRGTVAVQAALGAHGPNRVPDGLDAKLEGLRAV